MVTDQQVKRLNKLTTAGEPLARAAVKAGMSEKTARKYRKSDQLPSGMRPPRRWRTRNDPFEAVWDETQTPLQVNQGLQAKTLFADFQRRRPGRFEDGQIQTLQRKTQVWRATEGPSKEVFIRHVHQPGILAARDSTILRGTE